MKGRTVGVERIVSIMINMETLLLIAGTVQWYIQRAAQKLRWLGHFDGMEKSKMDYICNMLVIRPTLAI